MLLCMKMSQSVCLSIDHRKYVLTRDGLITTLCQMFDGKETDDQTNMANAFNKFFVSIASNIKEPIENSNFEKLKAFCDSKVPEETVFSIPEVSKEYIEKFLKHIDVSKATGCDGTISGWEEKKEVKKAN